METPRTRRAASMSVTATCRLSAEPGVAEVMPVPKMPGYAEPGGVSCTTGKSGPATKPASSRHPSALQESPARSASATGTTTTSSFMSTTSAAVGSASFNHVFRRRTARPRTGQRPARRSPMARVCPPQEPPTPPGLSAAASCGARSRSTRHAVCSLPGAGRKQCAAARSAAVIPVAVAVARAGLRRVGRKPRTARLTGRRQAR